jgi:hypothetical protein
MFKTLTRKQLGDVTELLVGDHLTAAGYRVVMCRPNNPGSDLVAERDGETRRVEVKSHRATHDHPAFRFPLNGCDQVALVLVVDETPRIWLFSRDDAAEISKPLKDGRRRLSHKRLLQDDLAKFENNFAMREG